jgi:hypothetical protein
VVVSAIVEYYTADDTWTLAIATSEGASFSTDTPVANSTYTGTALDYVGPYTRGNDGLSLSDMNIAAVPEPTSLGLLVAGGLVGLIRRRR